MIIIKLCTGVVDPDPNLTVGIQALCGSGSRQVKKGKIRGKTSKVEGKNSQFRDPTD